MRLRYLSLPLLALATLGGCLTDAERTNRFDPSSPFYAGEVLAGTVTRFNPPFTGIGGATVRLTPLDSGIERIARTDAEGRFGINDVPSGAYVLSAHAEGYAPADTTIEVSAGSEIDAVLPLNGVPTVEQRVHTERLDRWFPEEPLYRLVVDATVGDPDGVADIDSVVFTIPDLGFSAPLTVEPGEPDTYAGVFEEDELPAPLPLLAGLPFQVEATDGAGATGRAQGVQIVRILQDPPQPVFPLAQAVVRTETPTLRWNPLGLAFPFQYRVRLGRVFEGIETVLWAPADLPLTQTELDVPPGYLTPGDGYFWTVAVVDGFGNLSRSRPAGFSVTF